MRKGLLCVLAMLSGLLPVPVLAVALESLELNSALNQPFNARIGLRSVDPEDIDRLRVQLAPKDLFDRAGVVRGAILMKLQFSVKSDSNGVWIHVTSRDSIREPFLDFLIQVDSSDGRVVREYKVLLNAPGQ